MGFNRLIQAVDEFAAKNSHEDIFAQIGQITSSTYVPKNIKYEEFISPSTYNELFHSSKLIVSHAGMGSIITALQLQKPIVVMPRYGRLKETRNDHQIATANRFQGRRGLYVATDETDLAIIINKALGQLGSVKQDPALQYANKELIRALKNFIFESYR